MSGRVEVGGCLTLGSGAEAARQFPRGSGSGTARMQAPIARNEERRWEVMTKGFMAKRDEGDEAEGALDASEQARAVNGHGEMLPAMCD